MSDGIWIPAEVWALDLPPLHRVFLARLVALSQSDGASWAGDEFLAESLGCTPQHVRKMRGQLEASGHIITEGYGHKRRLTVELAPVGTSNQRNKQPQKQKKQPEKQELQPQLRQEATTVAESKEENRISEEVVKKSERPKVTLNPVVLPWDTDTFAEAWDQWKEYKRVEHRFSFKGSMSEQTSLHQLSNLAGGSEATAIAIIGHSIANGYKGLFPPGRGATPTPQQRLETLRGAVEILSQMK